MTKHFQKPQKDASGKDIVPSPEEVQNNVEKLCNDLDIARKHHIRAMLGDRAKQYMGNNLDAMVL